jgi:hypothetical protein
LVFPLQFGFANLFGDIFQLALGHLQLRLEAEGVELSVGHGGVMVGLQGVARQGLTGRRRGWIPLNQPETKMIVKNKRGSKMNRRKGIDDHCLRRALARLPSASSAAQCRLLLHAMLLGFALVGEEDLRLARI